MSTSKSYHHGDLQRALIEAGLASLRSDGVGGLSLRATARRAGVSSMAPYRHFADRDALLAAIAAEGFRLLERQLTAAAAAQDPRRGLLDQGIAYVAFACAEPALFKVMFGPLIDQTAPHPELEQAGGAAFEALGRAVARLEPLAASQDQADAALACWSVVHGLASLILDGRLGPVEPAAISARVTAILLDGVMARLRR